jgi:hypothetical protein
MKPGTRNQEPGIGVVPETTVAGQHSMGPRPLRDAGDVFPIPYSLFPTPAGGTA